MTATLQQPNTIYRQDTKDEKNKYAVPLTLIFCLFFLWAISSNLLPTMIRQLMKTCELNAFEASFTESAY